jgi:alkanesulfonate monooxygenase SsuD/methylene tetrahydromethanopterin reductase-like flavin-dependent oxidoreductase (luciferase family)
MKFGIFDHVDRSHMALAEQFDRRLDYVARADALGFFCYHVAEHHATPLNMVPVPGVYLGAVARATRRMRLGPLVYLLPLYSPLRLIEEVGMLDHLSHGRLDFGVGRGVSPFELNYHKVDPETSREIFLEALDVVLNGLTHDKLTHEGKHFAYKDVPMELQSLQKPHPPVWYPSSTPESSRAAGQLGYNYSTLGPMARAKACLDAYREGYAERGGTPAGPALDFPGGTAISVNRHVVVAETDEKALAIADPAYLAWHASLTKLWRENNVQGPSFAGSVLADATDSVNSGAFIVGSPATVREQVEAQIDALGINYLTCAFYFGTIAHEDAMASMALFAEEVMPKLAATGLAA